MGPSALPAAPSTLSIPSANGPSPFSFARIRRRRKFSTFCLIGRRPIDVACLDNLPQLVGLLTEQPQLDSRQFHFRSKRVEGHLGKIGFGRCICDFERHVCDALVKVRYRLRRCLRCGCKKPQLPSPPSAFEGSTRQRHLRSSSASPPAASMIFMGHFTDAHGRDRTRVAQQGPLRFPSDVLAVYISSISSLTRFYNGHHPPRYAIAFSSATRVQSAVLSAALPVCLRTERSCLGQLAKRQRK